MQMELLPNEIFGHNKSTPITGMQRIEMENAIVLLCILAMQTCEMIIQQTKIILFGLVLHRNKKKESVC